jgi:hypothetical protein
VFEGEGTVSDDEQRMRDAMTNSVPRYRQDQLGPMPPRQMTQADWEAMRNMWKPSCTDYLAPQKPVSFWKGLENWFWSL